MLKPETRRMVERHTDDLLQAFAAPLAARFGRSIETIRAEGLKAIDFHTNEGIELTLPDGSTMSFHYAFFVKDDEQRIVGVFTEHCGYHCFGMADLEVRELRDGAEAARHRW
ncbi:MAG TPA: hypothetical protein VFF06_25965 [Polyangia bacterium]|nr:hypothetical protein [Polyangia bacterium]